MEVASNNGFQPMLLRSATRLNPNVSFAQAQNMDSITAKDHDELIEILKGIDISVPLRTEGRTTEHTERWSICRLLASLSNEFSFPISVTHRDRPDILLEQNTKRIGIEITELVPTNAAAIDAYRDRNEIEGPFALQRHRSHDEQLRGKDLSQRANATNNGACWVGDSVERDWLEAALSTINTKIAKLIS